MRFSLRLALVLALAAPAAPALADKGPDALPVPPSGVIGIANDAMLTPEFWVKQSAQPDRVLIQPDEIAARNARLLQVDASMHDLKALPATLDRAKVEGWIKDLSQYPSKPLFDKDGKPVAGTLRQEVTDQLALDRIPAQQPTRYGLVVQRAALRTFPTDLRVFTSADDHDIDRGKPHIRDQRQLRLERTHPEARNRSQDHAQNGAQRRVCDKDSYGADWFGQSLATLPMVNRLLPLRDDRRKPQQMRISRFFRSC